MAALTVSEIVISWTPPSDDGFWHGRDVFGETYAAALAARDTTVR